MNDNEMWPKLQYYFNEFVLFKIQNVGITLSHIAVAVVAVLLALLISRVVQNVLRKRVFPRFHLDAGLEFALLRITHYVIVIIGIYIGLTTINLPLGALVGLFAVVAVGIGFGLQNIASNFISGVILLLERPVKIGDRLEVDDVWGDVTEINLRTTIVTTPDNIAIIVPNSKLLESNVTNYSYGDKKIRLRIEVGIAYGSDVEKAIETLEKVAQDDGGVLDTPAPKVWFREFGDSSLNFQLLCWIPDAGRRNDIASDIRREIDRRFRLQTIEIPFPQRDLHLRSAEASLLVRQAGGSE